VQSRYALNNRIALGSMAFLAIFLTILLVPVCWDILVWAVHRELEFAGICLAFRVVVYFGMGISLVTWLVTSVKMNWWMLYRYRLMDSTLEVTDPVLRRSWVADLQDVTEIRRHVAGLPWIGRIEEFGRLYTYEFVTPNASGLIVCELLPMWTEIVEKCPPLSRTTILK
jgi:hypothetical protein